ncbi:MAG: glycosyltransferase family 4 protein [Chloroflexia bacterium]
MSAIRICFLCNEYPPGPHGGIGTMTRVLARALVEDGHQARVIGIYPRDYPAPDYEEDQGVRIWRYRETAFKFGWVRDRYRLYRTAARWAGQGKIDLVEVPDWEGWVAGWPRLSVPVVARLNGSVAYFAQELGIPLRRLAFLLERASLRRVDFWASASRYTADVSRKIFDLPTDCAAVLYNPVELPPASCSTTRSKNRVVFTGTITAKKGVISLIKAWPLVLEERADAVLDLYGKDNPTEDGQPSTQEYLRSQLDPEIAGSVRFHGHVAREELFEALETARVGVFPSYAEAFGIAPVEAMARGCPTIYSTRPPGPEIVREGLDGLLADPDRPEDIANKIVRLLNDDDLAEKLGKAGRKRVEECFSIQSMLVRNEAFYERCIERFRKKSKRG